MRWRTPKLVLVRTTIGSQHEAAALASRLMDGGAACVHLQEARSFYRWKGERRDESEWIVEARTTPGGEDEARRIMGENHPYDIPIIEAWNVRVNEEYFEWVGSDK